MRLVCRVERTAKYAPKVFRKADNEGGISWNHSSCQSMKGVQLEFYFSGL